MRRATPAERQAAILARIMLGADCAWIACALGRCQTNIHYWTSAAFREKAAACCKAYRAKRAKPRVRKDGPRAPLTKEQKLRKQLRRQARAEAMETGAAVASVYERWGVA